MQHANQIPKFNHCTHPICKHHITSKDKVMTSVHYYSTCKAVHSFFLLSAFFSSNYPYAFNIQLKMQGTFAGLQWGHENENSDSFIPSYAIATIQDTSLDFI